jgi:hypothetical protein
MDEISPFVYHVVRMCYVIKLFRKFCSLFHVIFSVPRFQGDVAVPWNTSYMLVQGLCDCWCTLRIYKYVYAYKLDFNVAPGDVAYVQISWYKVMVWGGGGGCSSPNKAISVPVTTCVAIFCIWINQVALVLSRGLFLVRVGCCCLIFEYRAEWICFASNASCVYG